MSRCILSHLLAKTLLQFFLLVLDALVPILDHVLMQELVKFTLHLLFLRFVLVDFPASDNVLYFFEELLISSFAEHERTAAGLSLTGKRVTYRHFNIIK